MKNMDIGDLVLLKPHRYPDPKAQSRAAGAADFLAQARVVNSLDEAIADCTLVLGTSARQRKLPWPTLFAHELGGWLTKDSAHLAAPGSKVAVLFGREASGLNNVELQACHAHLMIEANPDYSSLNLAMAVQLIAYELRVGLLRQVRCTDVAIAGALALPDYWDAPAAEFKDVSLLLDHWDQVLRVLAFYEPDNARQLLNRLRRLTQRLRLDHLEVGLLRGFLRAIQEQLAGKNGMR